MSVKFNFTIFMTKLYSYDTIFSDTAHDRHFRG